VMAEISGPVDESDDVRVRQAVEDLAAGIAPLLDVENRLARIMGETYRPPEGPQIPLRGGITSNDQPAPRSWMDASESDERSAPPQGIARAAATSARSITSETRTDSTVLAPTRESAALYRLGIALRRRRLELGMSQRQLARLIGLSAHGSLGDFERGTRIPPADVVVACEHLLSVEPDYLQGLRREALMERARGLRAVRDTGDE